MKKILILLMSPLFMTAVYDLIFYLPSALSGIYNDLSDIFPIYIFLQCIIFICLSFCFSYQYNFDALSNKYNYSINNGISSISSLFFLITCVFLFLFLFYNVFGNFDFMNIINQNSKFYAQSKIGTAWVFYLYQFFLLFMIYDIYKTNITKFKLFCIFSSILILGITGGRSLVISLFIIVLFILVLVHKIKIKVKTIIFMLIIFLVVFLGNALLRGGENNSLTKYWESNGARLDFDNSYILQDSLDYIKKNDDHYFIVLDDLYWLFFMRKFNPEKPVSSAETRLVYKEMLSDGRTTNLTFGIYGNFVINFGYSGLLISPILIIVINIIYLNLCRRLVERRCKDFVLLYFFLTYILVLRGGFFNVRILTALLVVTLSISFYELMLKLKFIR